MTARRFAVASLAMLAVAAAAIFGASPAARAQDAPPSPHGAGAADPHAVPVVPESVTVKAIDLSAMYDASERGTKQPPVIPLANRAVRALLRGGPSAATLDLTSDAAGTVTIPTAKLAPGTVVELIVPDPTGTARWPLFASLPFAIGQKLPEELGFVKVHEGESPLAFAQYLMTATVPDREDDKPSLRVNVIAQVENRAERLWIGPKSDISKGTLRFRVPREFTLVGVQVGGQDSTADVVPRPDGANDVVLHERFWPTVFSDQPQTVRLVLTGPYQEDAAYDFSFDAGVPLEEFRLNLEQGVLDYESGGDGTNLEDAGENPPISGRVTHAWRAGHVHDGGRVNVRFTAGTRIHPKVWYTLGALALGIAGAWMLARAMARRGDAAPEAAPAKAPAAAAVPDVASKLQELDQRHRRGEITSFEYEARKRALLTPPPVKSETRAGRAATGDDALDAISARVDTADAETLRRDVRSLLAMLRSKGR